MARNIGDRSNQFPKTIADFGVKINPSSNQLSVSISGTSGLSLSTSNPPATFARTNLELTHSWHWMKGRHEISFGADVMFSRYNEYNFYRYAGVTMVGDKGKHINEAEPVDVRSNLP